MNRRQVRHFRKNMRSVKHKSSFHQHMAALLAAVLLVVNAFVFPLLVYRFADFFSLQGATVWMFIQSMAHPAKQVPGGALISYATLALLLCLYVLSCLFYALHGLGFFKQRYARWASFGLLACFGLGLLTTSWADTLPGMGLVALPVISLLYLVLHKKFEAVIRL